MYVNILIALDIRPGLHLLLDPPTCYYSLGSMVIDTLPPCLGMRYRVTFKKRFDHDGNGTDRPESLLNLADGVVEEASIIEQVQPDSVHVEEEMDEDDDFLSFGSEMWEYQVVEGRGDEFVTALKESGVVVEYDVIDEADGE
jgi:hypothetical protein